VTPLTPGASLLSGPPTLLSSVTTVTPLTPRASLLPVTHLEELRTGRSRLTQVPTQVPTKPQKKETQGA